MILILFMAEAIIFIAFRWLVSEITYRKTRSELSKIIAEQRIRIYDERYGAYIDVVGKHEDITYGSIGIKRIKGTDLIIEYYENNTLDRYTEIRGTAEIVIDESTRKFDIVGDDLEITNVTVNTHQ